MTSEIRPQKKYSLFVLAILLLALACVAFVFASNDFGIRALGLVAILASGWLIRISNVHRSSNSGNSGSARVTKSKRIGSIWWAAGAGCLLAAGGSYLYLRNDALNGYHQVLPVFVFAGVGLACAVVWGYIAVRILQ